jgi:hypothetical protein
VLTFCGILTVLLAAWLLRMLLPHPLRDMAKEPTPKNIGVNLAFAGFLVAFCGAVGLTGLVALGVRVPEALAIVSAVPFTLATAIGVFIVGFRRGRRGAMDGLVRLSLRLKSLRLLVLGLEEMLMLIGPAAALICAANTLWPHIQRAVGGH